MFVTFVLSLTMVVAGLKAGITPGASTLVVLTAWSCFKSQVSGEGGRRFLNLAQVSGSSGMAVVSGVIFTAPLLQHLHLGLAQKDINDANGIIGPTPDEWDITKIPWNDAAVNRTGSGLIEQYYKGSFPEVDPTFMMLFTFAGALIGYGFVGVSTKKFLSDPTLPAPEAHACNTMIRASAADAAQQPAMAISLGWSTVFSFIMPLTNVLGLTKSYLYLFKRVSATGREFAIIMPCSPTYIGIGGLLTLSTAISTASGAFVRLIGDAAVAPLTGEQAEMFPASTMKWVGGGAMSVGVVFSLIKFMSPMAADANADNGDVALLDIPQKTIIFLWSSIGAGVVLVAVGILRLSEDWFYGAVMLFVICLMASLMVQLGAILSLQIGSSASPVSGTVFVTTLTICLASLFYRKTWGSEEDILEVIEGISYMLVTACVAVSSANDASQDYKTLQLGGVAPRDGFIAQILGLAVGAVTVPVSYWLAHSSYGLGTTELPAPQGALFSTIIQGIIVNEVIPWYPVFIGLAIGVTAVIIEVVAARKGQMLPAMAFAVGLYLPPQLGVGIVWGAGFRYYGERMHKEDTGKEERTYESILTAAGMITGSAFLDLVVGVLIFAGVSPSAMDLGFFSAYSDSPTILSVMGLLMLGWLLYYNSRNGVPEATSQPDTLQNQLSLSHSLSKVSVGMNLLPPEERETELAS